jgi:hypothetical protein
MAAETIPMEDERQRQQPPAAIRLAEEDIRLSTACLVYTRNFRKSRTVCKMGPQLYGPVAGADQKVGPCCFIK